MKEHDSIRKQQIIWSCRRMGLGWREWRWGWREAEALTGNLANYAEKYADLFVR